MSLPRPATRHWREHLLETWTEISALLTSVHRIAVLGMKTEESGQPAFYVPHYAARAGYEIVPVPVYYPDVTEILGRKVYRRLADVPGSIDMVNVFRRSERIPEHLDDILAVRPKAVWMQLGIRHDGVANTLAREGISVVQDRCLLVDLHRMGR